VVTTSRQTASLEPMNHAVRLPAFAGTTTELN
jgi:hypothetical protein